LKRKLSAAKTPVSISLSASRCFAMATGFIGVRPDPAASRSTLMPPMCRAARSPLSRTCVMPRVTLRRSDA